MASIKPIGEAGRRLRDDGDRAYASPEAIAHALVETTVDEKTVHARYLKGVVKALGDWSLPTSADGVHVIIATEKRATSGPFIDAHGTLVLQSLAGVAGLAKEARVDLLLESPVVRAHPADRDLENIGLRKLDEVIRAEMSKTFAGRLDVLKEVEARARAVNRDQTTLVNISASSSIASLTQWVVARVLHAPNSALAREVSGALGHAPTQRDEDALAALLLPKVQRAMARASTALSDARAALTAQVIKLREARVLIFQSAGNWHEFEKKHGVESVGLEAVPGVVRVGAVDLGHDPTGTSDDTVASFSLRGPILGAVGVNVPINDQLVSGTSFASPFAVSVAALMVKANPTLRPDEIERILRTTAVPVEGGLSQVDVLAAVRLAKLLGRPRGAGWLPSTYCRARSG